METRTLGTFIAFLRKEKRLTQKQLAELLNVSDKTVSHWECDETSPDISLLPTLAEALGVTVDELLKGEKAPPQPTVEHHYFPPKSEGFATRTINKIKSKMAGDISERYRYFRMLSLVGTIIPCVVITIIVITNLIAGNYFLNEMAFIPGVVAFVGSLWILAISTGLTLGARLAFYKSILPSTEATEEEKKYIYKSNAVCFNNLYLVFCTLPMALTGFQDILDFAVILNVAIAIISLAVLWLVLTVVLTKKGIIATSKKRMLKIKYICMCFVLVACGIAAGLFIQVFWYPAPENIIFESAEEFINYMETPADKPENAYILNGVQLTTYPPTMPVPGYTSPTESPVQAPPSADANEEIGETVMGYCGEDYVTFRWHNKEVYDFTYNEEKDTFHVITYESKIKSEQQFDMRDDILSVIVPYYCVPVTLICFVIYKRKAKNLSEE